jgi:bacterioferritin
LLSYLMHVGVFPKLCYDTRDWHRVNCLLKSSPGMAPGERGQSMEITKEQLLDKLNQDLAWEYAALIQYVQHASVITGAEYESMIQELLIHANEEMAHAIALSDQIDFLGGVPAVDVEQVETSGDSKEMLEQDLAGEFDAISRYKERIAEAERLQEYGLRRVLEDILIVEEEHARDLLTALGR